MKEKKFTQLSSTDQHEISILKSKWYSLRDIARTLNRNVSSISREINKNSVNGIYDPVKAKVKRYQRRKYCKIYLKKIREHVDLEEYIREKIKCDWSPETISNMWNIDNPESDFTISSKTIYQYCYSAWWQDLCKHLYLKRTRAKKYKKSWEWWNNKRQLIPECVWIDKRPEVINNRSRVWDTEWDFIVSKKWDPTVMLTNIDRKSRYVQAKKLIKRNW